MGSEYILETYGEAAWRQIAEMPGNTVLVYADENSCIPIRGIFTDHGMTVDDFLDFMEIDMDAWAEEQGLDGWDWFALQLVYTK